MKYKTTGDPGTKTGIYSRKNTVTGVTTKIYRLRKISDGGLIDYEDDGAGPAGPNQGRQSLLRAVAGKMQKEDGQWLPRFVADDDSMGSIVGPGGFPVEIKVIDAAIIEAMEKFKEKRGERKAQYVGYREMMEEEAEADAAPKKRRRRRKKEGADAE